MGIQRLIKAMQPANAFDLNTALDLLRGDHDAFGARVKEVPCGKIADYPRVNTQFYYLAFRDGLPTIEEFLDYLKWQMVPFCIPRRDRMHVEDQLKTITNNADRTRLMVGQFEKARNLFIKAQKQQEKAGEPGELILFVLLEWALHAPQLISKMYLKTSADMPVHGSDGIHAKLDADGQTLLLFWGESKLHADISGGVSAVFDSITKFKNEDGKEKREVEILRDHMNLGDDQKSLTNSLLEYLDPYTGKQKANSRRHIFACLLGFDFDKYNALTKLPPDKAEEQFRIYATKRVPEILKMIQGRLENDGMSVLNFEFFLIPFPSIMDFRTAFFKYTGITNV